MGFYDAALVLYVVAKYMKSVVAQLIQELIRMRHGTSIRHMAVISNMLAPRHGMMNLEPGRMTCLLDMRWLMVSSCLNIYGGTWRWRRRLAWRAES